MSDQPKGEIEVYSVVTERDGAPVKNGREIAGTEYVILATSVQEAVEIIQKSITDESEVIKKVWHVTHLARGLAGAKYIPACIA